MNECIDKTELEREYKLLIESEKLNYETFCFTVSSLSEEELEEFFKVAEEFCTGEELKALKIGVSYFRLLRFPKLGKAIKEAIAETLYKEFNEGSK